jgi:hypothetical protein
MGGHVCATSAGGGVWREGGRLRLPPYRRATLGVDTPWRSFPMRKSSLNRRRFLTGTFCTLSNLILPFDTGCKFPAERGSFSRLRNGRGTGHPLEPQGNALWCRKGHNPSPACPACALTGIAAPGQAHGPRRGHTYIRGTLYLGVRPWEPFTVKEILPEPARIFTRDISRHGSHRSGNGQGKGIPAIGQVAQFIVAEVTQFIIVP